MRHGYRASWEHNKQKELWSRRYKGVVGFPTSKTAKKMTHRFERRQSKKIVFEEISKKTNDECS